MLAKAEVHVPVPLASLQLSHCSEVYPPSLLPILKLGGHACRRSVQNMLVTLMLVGLVFIGICLFSNVVGLTKLGISLS